MACLLFSKKKDLFWKLEFFSKNTDVLHFPEDFHQYQRTRDEYYDLQKPMQKKNVYALFKFDYNKISRKNDKAVKIMLKNRNAIMKNNRRLRARMGVRFLLFFSELAPTDPWCNSRLYLNWKNMRRKRQMNNLGKCVSHCVKVSKYGVFSGPYFPEFGLNMKRYSVSLSIQLEYGKVRTRKNSVFGHFSRSVVDGCFYDILVALVTFICTCSRSRNWAIQK